MSQLYVFHNYDDTEFVITTDREGRCLPEDRAWSRYRAIEPEALTDYVDDIDDAIRSLRSDGYVVATRAGASHTSLKVPAR